MDETNKQRQAIQVANLQIKCDTSGCDYLATTSPATFEEYVNTPCPKCGAVLLTEQDAALLRVIVATQEYINAVAGPIPDGSRPDALLTLASDGSGALQDIQVKPLWPILIALSNSTASRRRLKEEREAPGHRRGRGMSR